MEWRPAGDQNLQGETGGKQTGNDIGGIGQDMLAVVEQQQGLPGLQMADELIGNRPAGPRVDAERPGDGYEHTIRPAHGGEIDPGHTIGEGRGDVLGDRETQPGFAHAARTGQGQEGQRVIDQQCPGVGTLPVAANERGARLRLVQTFER